MVLNDDEIATLIEIRKNVSTPNARSKVQKGSSRSNYKATSDNGDFEIFVRQNLRIQNAFSCGLLYHHPSGEKITLMRCNGSDHKHRNPLNSTATMEPCCHIHVATQKYMEAGRKAEMYAERTTLYSDVKGALATLIRKCNIHGLDDLDGVAQNDLWGP